MPKSQQPYEWVSLMELLEMYAGAYWRMSGMIGQIICHLEAGAMGATLSEQVHDAVGGTLGELQRDMERLRLESPLKQLQRIRDYLNGKESNGEVVYSVLRQRIAALHERMIDDLEARCFLCVPQEVTELYRQPRPLFGEEVEKKFPQMAEDVSEAGKCLSLYRPTAAVFHLMRVMEIAVQRFGDRLGVRLVKEQNWQVILDQINAAIRKMDHKEQATKTYAEAASHLYNVKVAWRNEVMHPKQTYTFEEANAIFGNAKTFVIDLAGLI